MDGLPLHDRLGLAALCAGAGERFFLAAGRGSTPRPAASVGPDVSYLLRHGCFDRHSFGLRAPLAAPKVGIRAWRFGDGAVFLGSVFQVRATRFQMRVDSPELTKY